MTQLDVTALIGQEMEQEPADQGVAGAVTADHTLTTIGAVLEDYEASTDAMRWAPDRVICDGGGVLRIESRYGPSVIPAGLSHYEFAVRVIESFALWGSAYIEAATPVIRAFTEAWNKLAAAYSHDLSVSFLGPAEKRRHRRRCRRCNPWGNPKPSAGQFKPGPKAARTRRRH